MIKQLRTLFCLLLFVSTAQLSFSQGYTAKMGLKVLNIPYLGLEYHTEKWGFEAGLTSRSDNLFIVGSAPMDSTTISGLFFDGYNRRFLDVHLQAKKYFLNGFRDFEGFGSYVGAIVTVSNQMSIDDTYFTDYEEQFGIALADRRTTMIGIAPTLGYKHYINKNFSVDFGYSYYIRPVVIGLENGLDRRGGAAHIRLGYSFPTPRQLSGFSGDDEMEVDERDRDSDRRKSSSRKKKKRKKKRR